MVSPSGSQTIWKAIPASSSWEFPKACTSPWPNTPSGRASAWTNIVCICCPRTMLRRQDSPSDVLLPLLIEFITADKILIIIRCIAMIIWIIKISRRTWVTLVKQNCLSDASQERVGIVSPAASHKKPYNHKHKSWESWNAGNPAFSIRIYMPIVFCQAENEINFKKV